MTSPSRRRDAVPDGYDGTTALANARWEAFAQLYVGEYRRNAAGAYKAAGFRPKNDHVATVVATRILTNVSIKKRISYLESEALERIRMTALDATRQLGAMVSADYADFLDENGNVDISKVRDPRLAPAVEYCDAVYDKEGCQIGWRLRLHDKKKALELLGLTAQKDDAQSQNNQILVIKA